MPMPVPDLWHPLFRDVLPLAYDARPVTGVMAPFVGRRYTEEEVWRFRQDYADVHEEEEAELHPLAARIRAFDVPALAGAQLTVSRLAELPSTVYKLLEARLPGWQWEAQQEGWPQNMSGPVKKYAILHTMRRAPDDETTQQPMILELFGYVTALNGGKVGMKWFGPRLDDRAAEDAIFLGELRLEIERATYANTYPPGIGVPFYS